MRTTIDAAGRVVIPKKIREAAGLRPGTPLEIDYADGRIEIEPSYRDVRLERRGHFLVAVPVDDTPPLPAEEIAAMREEILLEREQKLLG
ncbi:MAG TPA: AbrB/MazE/SpoVT family DNA-binding domain-containing protein [Tepidiformaceae bacterium]|nr:AbrB/MazE/SpoVT family DNA-binding domain-containing protein [Tepidiformaceae bacterium]